MDPRQTGQDRTPPKMLVWSDEVMPARVWIIFSQPQIHRLLRKKYHLLNKKDHPAPTPNNSNYCIINTLSTLNQTQRGRSFAVLFFLTAKGTRTTKQSAVAKHIFWPSFLFIYFLQCFSGCVPACSADTTVC